QIDRRLIGSVIGRRPALIHRARWTNGLQAVIGTRVIGAGRRTTVVVWSITVRRRPIRIGLAITRIKRLRVGGVVIVLRWPSGVWNRTWRPGVDRRIVIIIVRRRQRRPPIWAGGGRILPGRIILRARLAHKGGDYDGSQNDGSVQAESIPMH